MGDFYKTTIDPECAEYLDNGKRAEWRVNIRNGFFEQNGEKFDTSSMISKGKKGYAAYTLNANGELSVFSHTSNKFFHSSMKMLIVEYSF